MRYDDLNALLKKNGSSLTKSRKIVFDLMLYQQPQTMQRLVERAKDIADRATVYRTVELFEELGIVHRLNIGWKHKFELTDIFHSHHHHFYCTKCGKTYSLPANQILEAMINSTATNEAFSPRGHQLEIYGLCKKCQPV